MNILTWIIVGGIAGWLSTKIIKPKRRKGCFSGIALGIIGAIFGGFIVTHFFDGTGVTGFDFYSIFVATLGSVFLIWLVRLFGDWKKRDEEMNVGTYKVVLNAINLVAKTYFYRLKVNNTTNPNGFVQTKKLLLIK